MRRSSRRRAASHWPRRKSATSICFDVRRRFRIEPRQAHQPVDQTAHVLFLERHRRENLSRDASALRSRRGAARRYIRRSRSAACAARATRRRQTAACAPRRDAGRSIAAATLAAASLIRRGQRRDFVAACHDEAALRVVAVRQRAQRIADFVDRPQRLLREEPADEPREQHRRQRNREDDAPVRNRAKRASSGKDGSKRDVAALDVRQVRAARTASDRGIGGEAAVASGPACDASAE